MRAGVTMAQGAERILNRLARYRSLVFDCDGVLLDSNRIKTEAMYHTALPYGEQAAQQLVDYHRRHGGVSRYAKFAYLIEELAPGVEGPPLEALLEDFGARCRRGLETCAVADGLHTLRERTQAASWLIVSGGDQQELRAVFAERALAALFDGGIFGSPDTKAQILEREIAGGRLQLPALFFGDSRLDHEASSAAGLDFVFVSGWSEFADWRAYCGDHSLDVVASLAELAAA